MRKLSGQGLAIFRAFSKAIASSVLFIRILRSYQEIFTMLHLITAAGGLYQGEKGTKVKKLGNLWGEDSC